MLKKIGKIALTVVLKLPVRLIFKNAVVGSVLEILQNTASEVITEATKKGVRK